MAPHPSGLPHPGLALGGGSGLLALSGALGAQLASKDERAHFEAVAAAAAAEHHRGITNKIILTDRLTGLLTTGTELSLSAVIMLLCFNRWDYNECIIGSIFQSKWRPNVTQLTSVYGGRSRASNTLFSSLTAKTRLVQFQSKVHVL